MLGIVDDFYDVKTEFLTHLPRIEEKTLTDLEGLRGRLKESQLGLRFGRLVAQFLGEIDEMLEEARTVTVHR